MRFAFRIAGVGAACVVVAVRLVTWMAALHGLPKTAEQTQGVSDVKVAGADSDVRLFSDANAPGTGSPIFVDRGLIDDDIFNTFMFEGKFAEAAAWLERACELSRA